MVSISFLGYSPVTVITYLDKIKGDDKKEDAFDHASSATGSSSQRTYFIANYTDEQRQTSLTAERTALDVLEYSLMSAESFIQIRKQKEKNQMERDVAAGCKCIPQNCVDDRIRTPEAAILWMMQRVTVSGRFQTTCNQN